jgi:2-C-methyl-D-erythritol 2,4-cyclodiphosphate synthase
MRLRVGQGFDVHALVPGRRLVLGGIDLPGPQGLLGHSDADVLTHALIDALLGAAALGDIAQQPKIAPHVAAMRAALAGALQIDAGAVSIKGKTTEWLGFTGRGEGIAALVVVALVGD